MQDSTLNVALSDPMLAAKTAALESFVLGFRSAVVAFSGGVDSSLVAYVCGRLLGERAIAVTSGSASLKRSDLALTNALATSWGLRHRVIETRELESADYRANPTNRCYFCKSTLFTALDAVAREESAEVVFSGTNVDDLGDHRPGLIAAAEHAVRAPLAEAGFTKSDIRALAAHFELETAAKPQSACLASRVPYGHAIDAGILAQIDAAEAVLDRHGFQQCRVRHHDDVARLEIPADDLARALALRGPLVHDLKAVGYRHVALDLAGFRSGSMNDGLRPDQRISAVTVFDPDGTH
ncbi:MAG: ATP-dependent sacrificial sulfur transferase LarE [Pseudomonadota bacterium]